MKRIGIYLSSGDMKKPIAVQIKKLLECGAARANLWVESPDGRRAPLSLLREWSGALRAEGIEPWLWTFPNAAFAGGAGRYLREAAMATSAVGMWLDIERPPPMSPARDWTREDAEALMRKLAGTPNLGITSYPVISNFKKHIPFDAFAQCEIGAPQLYRSASVVAQREKAIREWSEAYPRIVPIVAGFLGDTKKLERDLSAVVADRFQVFDVWVLAALDAAERRVLSQWAKK